MSDKNFQGLYVLAEVCADAVAKVNFQRQDTPHVKRSGPMQIQHKTEKRVVFRDMTNTMQDQENHKSCNKRRQRRLGYPNSKSAKYNKPRGVVRKVEGLPATHTGMSGVDVDNSAVVCLCAEILTQLSAAK